MNLGDRLTELRQERHWSLRKLRYQIAAQSGRSLAVSYLAKLEHGGATPSLDVMVNIAHGYGLTLGDLMGPVDGFIEPARPNDGQYPASLRRFIELSQVSQDWIDTLARIEYRGRRPNAVAAWQAIYAVLRLCLDDKEDR